MKEKAMPLWSKALQTGEKQHQLFGKALHAPSSPRRNAFYNIPTHFSLRSPNNGEFIVF